MLFSYLEVAYYFGFREPEMASALRFRDSDVDIYTPQASPLTTTPSSAGPVRQERAPTTENDIKILSEFAHHTAEQFRTLPARLRHDLSQLNQSYEDTAVKNFRVFVESSRCVDAAKDAASGMLASSTCFEAQASSLTSKATAFLETVAKQRKVQHQLSLLRNRQDSLIQLMETPALVSGLAHADLSEEAFEVLSYLDNLHSKTPSLKLISSLRDAALAVRPVLLNKLVDRLKGKITLALALRTVTDLRRLGVFEESQLRALFLAARSVWVDRVLALAASSSTSSTSLTLSRAAAAAAAAASLSHSPSSPHDELAGTSSDLFGGLMASNNLSAEMAAVHAHTVIVTYIDSMRSSIFDVCTQYRAIFVDGADSDSSIAQASASLTHPSSSSSSPSSFSSQDTPGWDDWVDDSSSSSSSSSFPSTSASSSSSSSLSTSSASSSSTSLLLSDWVSLRLTHFTAFLETHLPRVSSGYLRGSVRSRILHTAQTLARTRIDLCALVAPLFTQSISAGFASAMTALSQRFATSLNTLPWTMTKSQIAVYGIPLVTLPHPLGAKLAALTSLPPLAVYAHGFIEATNQLRPCLPVDVRGDITNSTKKSIEAMVSALAAASLQVATTAATSPASSSSSSSLTSPSFTSSSLSSSASSSLQLNDPTPADVAALAKGIIKHLVPLIVETIASLFPLSSTSSSSSSSSFSSPSSTPPTLSLGEAALSGQAPNFESSHSTWPASLSAECAAVEAELGLSTALRALFVLFADETTKLRQASSKAKEAGTSASKSNTTPSIISSDVINGTGTETPVPTAAATAAPDVAMATNCEGQDVTVTSAESAVNTSDASSSATSSSSSAAPEESPALSSSLTPESAESLPPVVRDRTAVSASTPDTETAPAPSPAPAPASFTFTITSEPTSAPLASSSPPAPVAAAVLPEDRSTTGGFGDWGDFTSSSAGGGDEGAGAWG